VSSIGSIVGAVISALIAFGGVLYVQHTARALAKRTADRADTALRDQIEAEAYRRAEDSNDRALQTAVAHIKRLEERVQVLEKYAQAADARAKSVEERAIRAEQRADEVEARARAADERALRIEERARHAETRAEETAARADQIEDRARRSEQRADNLARTVEGLRRELQRNGIAIPPHLANGNL
jgi:uncharacterized protein (DUF3084 family)